MSYGIGAIVEVITTWDLDTEMERKMNCPKCGTPMIKIHTNCKSCVKNYFYYCPKCKEVS